MNNRGLDQWKEATEKYEMVSDTSGFGGTSAY
jgi:hypothetical protein